MHEVPATEFTRNFGRYREIAQRERIAVTSHGRATGYFASAVEYEDLQRIKSASRRRLAVTDLAPGDIEAMTAGRMAPEAAAAAVQSDDAEDARSVARRAGQGHAAGLNGRNVAVPAAKPRRQNVPIPNATCCVQPAVTIRSEALFIDAKASFNNCRADLMSVG